MIKQILRLLCFTQIALTQIVFAQTNQPAESAEPTTASSSSQTTQLPMFGPFLPKPVKKSKALCTLVAHDSLTAVYMNDKRMARDSNFNESIQQLKSLVSNKLCIHKIQTCSVIGGDGESAVSIDDNPASPFSNKPNNAARDIKLLTDAKICNFDEPTYAVLTVDGRIAVYIDGNRATPFSANAKSAEEDLKSFTSAFNNTSDVISSESGNVASSNLTSVEQKTNSEKTELNKLKNLKCWKGISANTQDKNKILCEKKMKSNQICESSMYLNDQAVFDVCLQGFEGKPNRVVNCIKGTNLNEQTENLKLCRTQLQTGQICEANLLTHEHAKYDVCIME
ncbi:MAG: hypothetical protein AABY64_07145 [Bdellovibrionota bacterium]